ncbi:MAG: type II toxin-antitoxin system prevent-host-death family antitoxin [Pseudonocardia sp.]|nr:type II toxin-antitoxin system prevent-host-death family antitoxin [Pseudonocardia sp.]
MAHLSVSQARAHLTEVLDRVVAGEEITITRHGQPLAVLLRPDVVRARRAEATIGNAAEIGALLSAAREVPLAPAAVAVDRAEELVGAVRAARDDS